MKLLLIVPPPFWPVSQLSPLLAIDILFLKDDEGQVNFATIPQLHTPEVWTLLEQQGVIKELLSGETSEFQTKRGDANVTDGKCYSGYWNELKDNCNWKAHLRQGLPWLKRESNSLGQENEKKCEWWRTHTHPSELEALPRDVWATDYFDSRLPVEIAPAYP